MENRKATKRALLTSITALVMCVVMLVGTTFAWFTDTAKTNVNRIEAGNLDVVLQVRDNGGWITSNRALTWVKNAAGSSQELLWEPGASYNLEEFRILNNGNLNLKYKVIISGATGDTTLLDVIDFSGKITDENNVVNALTSVSMNSTTPVILDRELAAGKADTITLKGTMQTSANNTYMNKTVDNITITVVATQATGEYDSTGNTYDETADYTIQVNKDNIQDYLDGKFGSIDGMTLVLAEGDYDKIEFGRATAYEGSNTKYYLGGTESNVNAIKQDIANHPNGGAGNREYVRYMNNVTLKAADGAAATINGLVAFGGQVNSTKWYSRDFVADRVAENNNTCYYINQKWNNITFEGLTFTGGVNIEAYQGNTLIDNVKFDRCRFNVSDTDTNKANCIRLNVDGKAAKANNLVVTNCEFTDGYTAVLTDGMPNVTVTGSTFSGLTKHAINPMMNWNGAPGYGRITVTGNTFKNMSSDSSGTILRMGEVGAGAVFTIKNNTATDGITLANSIKVNSLADGITYDISGNSWASGLTASDSRLNG